MAAHRIRRNAVLIAGGAKNLGGLIARDLAAQGAKAITVHSNTSATTPAAEETAAIRAAGADAFAVQAAFTSANAVETLFAEAKAAISPSTRSASCGKSRWSRYRKTNMKR